MADVVVEQLATGFGLIEGPVWSENHGLLFSDTIAGGVYALGPPGSPTCLIPHRRGIGGMALHAGGGIVVGGRNIAVKMPLADGGWRTMPLLEADPPAGIVGFNDLTVDTAGRLYVGSLGFSTADGLTGDPGHLHIIDLDGTSRIVADDIMMTNGLAFSPDGAVLYHADSTRPAVYAYPVEPNGDVGPRRTLFAPEAGNPDGIAVDHAGTIWVALAAAGRVVGLDPGGREVASVPVPVPMVTSLCFGGPDLAHLYIVSGSEGLATDRGGSVFRCDVGRHGLFQPYARVAVSR